jgi:competence protein ComEC
MRSPLIPVASCFALGILLAHAAQFSPSSTQYWISVLCAGGGVCLLLGLIILRSHPGPPDKASSEARAYSRGAAAADIPSAGKHTTRTGQVQVASERHLRQTVCGVLALTGFVFAGAAAFPLLSIRFPPNHVSRLQSLGIDSSQPLSVEGHIASTPRRTSSGLQFDLQATGVSSPGQRNALKVAADAPYSRLHAVSGKIRLQLDAAGDFAALESLHLRFGDSVRALVRLRRPRVYRNPGAFDFRSWLESIEDVYWMGTITGAGRVEKRPGVASPGAYPEKARRRLLEAIDRIYPPWTLEGRNGAVLKAALLGDRSAIDSETVENFRKVGLYHLLVIAGLHVGLLAMLAEMFLRLVRFGEAWRSALVLVLLLGYALLVEQRAPTLRATLMITVYLLARLFYRDHTALNAVGLSALVLLVYRPAWLFESGFQLSFSAALIIVGLAAPILERTTEPYRRALWELHELDFDAALEPRQAQFRLDLRLLIATLGKWFNPLQRHPGVATFMVTTPVRAVLWAANILLFSAILQLGLLLPMAETFHRVTFAGVGLNAVAIPVMTLLLAIAVPTVILAAAVPVLATWPAKLLALVMQVLFALTSLPHLPPWLSYRVPTPPAWVAWGFAISLVLAACSLGRARKAFQLSLVAAAGFAVLVSLHPIAPSLPRGVMEITALDCGGGDTLFLVLPDRTTMLINTGAGPASGFYAHEGAFEPPRWDPGEEIVSPYLWSRGLKAIDVLLLTSMRETRGMFALMENFRIGEIWYPDAARPMPESLRMYTILDEARRRGTMVRELTLPGTLARGGASVQIAGWRASTADSGGVPRKSYTGSPPLRISHGVSSLLLLPGGMSGTLRQEWATADAANASAAFESKVLVLGQGAKLASAPELL